MKLGQSIFLVLLFGVSALSLTGCGTYLPMTPHQREIQTACENSDVLLSDLTQPVETRQYSLKPGVACNA